MLPRHSRVLIVARRTADSPELIEAVAQRAQEGPCNFTLLVPAFPGGVRRLGDPSDPGQRAAERRIGAAVPLLSRAAGAEVVAVVGAAEPLIAVRDTLKLLGFDEVIVSMLPPRASRWLQLGLPGKIRALGVPVTEVVGVGLPAPTVPAAGGKHRPPVRIRRVAGPDSTRRPPARPTSARGPGQTTSSSSASSTSATSAR